MPGVNQVKKEQIHTIKVENEYGNGIKQKSNPMMGD